MDKILIFRPDNIGDIILFNGALKHIRNKFPGAHITLAVLEHIVDLVELCPHVDRCISLQHLSWWCWIDSKRVPFAGSFKGIVRSLDRMRNRFRIQQYTMIIYPVKSPLPNHLEIVRDLGVKQIYGIAGCTMNAPEGGYPADIAPKALFSDYLDVSEKDPWQHEFFTTLEFLKFLGCEVAEIKDIEPEIWISDSDKSLINNKQTKSHRVIGLFPSASYKERCWNPQNYASLARCMHDGLTYVIFGGSRDSGVAHEVEFFLKKGRANINVINFVGKTTLRTLYKTVSACNLFIAMETSGLHLALSAGIPTIGIIGGGHYGRFVPWGNRPERQFFLTKKMECFNCNWMCTRDRFECIQDVRPEEVADKARMLLRECL